ncbi:hypothetical protein BDA99DRAFT_36641 [Phascolomyces articulosus]|uniref:Methyltransferase domain-containing protein n=1 Tax=Phascolomyces articulosus TaxID=60185 RepID=A0AAD5PEZ1_9FUNG|nr:hypothetical protein BDA99DRAFT_36641 [Phascolomyces articulosus]
MGVTQSKQRKSRSLSGESIHPHKLNNNNHHRSMFIPSEKASTLPKRGHNSSIPRTSAKSALGSSPSSKNPSPLTSSLTIQQTHNRNAISSVSLPPQHHEDDQDSPSSPQQNNTYIGGLESASRFLPDDTDSQDRGLTLHFALKRIFDGNVMPAVLSWFGNHAKVVDIGSLNGVWLMDMAVQFPKCQFIGIETTSSSSNTSVIPQVLSLHNVRFDNVDWDRSTRQIPLPDASVDICHMRAQSLNFERRSWLNLLSEAYRILKPGGVLQITDFHYAMTGTVLIESFIDTVRNILNTVNMDIDIALKWDKILKQHGFQVIESKRASVNFASHGQLGEDFMAATLTAFEEARDILAPKMGLDGDEYKQRVEMVCAQCVQQDAHINWYAFVGRKPIKQHS